MNDEIREILARLSRYVITPDVRHDFDDLLDYITNLQNENKMLKDNAIHNDKVVDKARWNEMIYKSRIEKAIKLMHDKLDRFDCDGSMAVSMSISYFEEDLLNILQNGSEK